MRNNHRNPHPTRPGRSLLCATAVAFLCGCTKTVHERDFFHPYKVDVIPDGVFRQNVEIVAPDSTLLRGWLLRPESPRGSLLYFYGNAETVSRVERRLCWLARRYQLTVLAIDYRGYGFSDGAPAGKRIFEDVLATFDFLRNDAGASPGPVLVFGRSLGSFVALHLASRRPVDGLMLEGTVTSIEDGLPTIRQLIPWYLRWAVRLRLGRDLLEYEPPSALIAKLATPVLIIHGERDEIFPVALARKLYESAPAGEKMWCPVPGAGHDDVAISREPARSCMDEFVGSCLQAKASR